MHLVFFKCFQKLEKMFAGGYEGLDWIHLA
jgi:hypothetical protein